MQDSCMQLVGLFLDLYLIISLKHKFQENENLHEFEDVYKGFIPNGSINMILFFPIK